MSTHSKKVADKFCDSCKWLHQSWQTRKYLFDENPSIDSLKKPHYADFFLRLNFILQEYWIQQLAKLHDPAVQYGHKNLSIDYMIDCGQWDAQTKAGLSALRAKMTHFETKLREARNKIISHNDLSTILQMTDFGKFNQGDDVEYFNHLYKFASIVSQRVLGKIFLYDDLVKNDVQFFMSAFERGSIVTRR